jgi:transposase
MPASGSYEAYSMFFGLKGFDVVAVELLEDGDEDSGSQRVKLVTIEGRGNGHECEQCGKRHLEGAAGCFRQTESIWFRDCSLGDFVTYVQVFPYRVWCCDGCRRVKLPFEAPGHRMTVRFFERIAALCTRLPIDRVAKMARLSWDTVARVDKAAIRNLIGGDTPDVGRLRHMGVDEVSANGGNDFFTIISNLETGQVLHIGDGKGDKGLAPFLDKLDKRTKRRICVTASDLGYLPLLQKHLPRAVHVLDRFHIVKWINDALTNLRRRLFGGAPTTEIGHAAKGLRWALLTGRENLDHKHKLLLGRLMELNRPLYKAYLLKEQLRDILGHSWTYLGSLTKNLTAWYHATMYSQLPELKKVARRLRRRFDNVVEGFRQNIKMGLVESINLTIGNLRREARGYRDHAYFKLKIYQRTWVAVNPWADIIL